MTIFSFISRLTLRKPSPSSAPRWLCTATEEATAEAAEAAVAAQPRRKTRLFFQVVNNVNSDKSSVADILNSQVNQGDSVKRYDILNLSSYFRRRKNFHAALQLYDWMEIRKFEIKNADQAVRIDLLGKAQGISSAENYFNSLQESEKTNKTYGALLCCYCKEKIIDKAIETFEVMKSSNYTSTLNYNNMLLLYYSIKKHDKLISLVQEMEENNIALDLYSYNMLINTYAALKNLDAIEGVLEKMKNNNVEGDLFTYGNLANVYFNSGLHEKANAFLEMMDKIETRQDKNVFEACRTRIKLYTEMNNLSGVHRAWDALKLAFPTPNNTSYLFMLLSLSKLGDQESLEKVFKEWEDNCSSFDFRIPNVLLDYYLSRDMIEKATSLYDSLVNRKNKPNLRTLNLFTTLHLKNGHIDEAMKYFEMGLDGAKAWNSDWFPTDDTVELIRKYFEENDDKDRADRFNQRMNEIKRVDPDSLVANSDAPDVGN